MGALHPSYIVGIGGSAGSLSGILALFRSLPTDTGMAFIVMTHFPCNERSELAQILTRYTKMKVTMATAAMRILANNI